MKITQMKRVLNAGGVVYAPATPCRSFTKTALDWLLDAEDRGAVATFIDRPGGAGFMLADDEGVSL